MTINIAPRETTNTRAKSRALDYAGVPKRPERGSIPVRPPTGDRRSRGATHNRWSPDETYAGAFRHLCPTSALRRAPRRAERRELVGAVARGHEPEWRSPAPDVGGPNLRRPGHLYEAVRRRFGRPSGRGLRRAFARCRGRESCLISADPASGPQEAEAIVHALIDMPSRSATRALGETSRGSCQTHTLTHPDGGICWGRLTNHAAIR